MEKILLFVSLILVVFCQSCTVITRSIRYYDADITDHEIFPYTEIKTGNEKFYFKKGNEEILQNYIVDDKDSSNLTLDKYLKQNSTVAFIVIRNDSVLFENYYKGYDKTKISTFFSVSKSITSMLVGLAVDDGYIKSVNDPVTKYIPELENSNPKFKSLTIEHLLNMRSGLKFKESYFNPFSGMARLYYGTNQLRQIKKLKFECEPDTKHEYQSIVTAILGIVVEKATGKELGEYLEEKIWIPLGMENKASWSLDDKRHRSAKAYCGLNATAIDLAKIGRLYLNNGNWNGKQIISKDWVKKSTTPYIENETYQYQWNSHAFAGDYNGQYYFQDSTSADKLWKDKYSKYKYYQVWENPDVKKEKKWLLLIYPGAYYAQGIMDQVLYVNPEKNLIMVRLGEGIDKDRYVGFMYKLNENL